MSIWINTWHLWLFIPYNLQSFKLTNLHMFEPCPSAKRRLFSHWYTNSCAFLSKAKAYFEICNPWPSINQLHIFMVSKQCYIYSSFDVILCLFFHVHNRVKNVLKYVLFYVHDVKVMAEEIRLPIRKLLENTLLCPVVSQTKTRKLLLTRLKTKQNINVL
jgi:hypothetical protein